MFHRDLRAESPYLCVHPVDPAAAPQLINHTDTEGLTAAMSKNTTNFCCYVSCIQIYDNRIE